MFSVLTRPDHIMRIYVPQSDKNTLVFFTRAALKLLDFLYVFLSPLISPSLSSSSPLCLESVFSSFILRPLHHSSVLISSSLLASNLVPPLCFLHRLPSSLVLSNLLSSIESNLFSTFHSSNCSFFPFWPSSFPLFDSPQYLPQRHIWLWLLSEVEMRAVVWWEEEDSLADCDSSKSKHSSSAQTSRPRQQNSHGLTEEVNLLGRWDHVDGRSDWTGRPDIKHFHSTVFKVISQPWLFFFFISINWLKNFSRTKC